MIDVSKLATNKEARNLLTAISLISGALIIVHYYNQIKLNRLKIEEIESKHANEDD